MPNTEHKTTEGEIKEIWERLTSGESSIKSAHHRIDGLERMVDSVHQMAISINQIVTEIKALREDYEQVDVRLEELEHKPIKRYEAILNTLLSVIISGVAGYFLALIFN